MRTNFVDLTHKKEQHGLTGHPLHAVWMAMRRRCDSPNNKYWNDYGGRGIIVCDEWNNLFSNFYNDMIDSYIPGYFLDRINNDGNYCKENCRFVSVGASNTNKRVHGKNHMPKGVSLLRGKFWRARIKVEGSEYHIGYFKTEEEGILAYQAIHKDWYGF